MRPGHEGGGPQDRYSQQHRGYARGTGAGNDGERWLAVLPGRMRLAWGSDRVYHQPARGGAALLCFEEAVFDGEQACLDDRTASKPQGLTAQQPGIRLARDRGLAQFEAPVVVR